MAQKIVLTGKPITPLRFVKRMSKGKDALKVFTFDMEESGSPAPAKSLPKASKVVFTVFVNDRQLKKAGIDENNIMEQKLLVQGDIVLDVNINDCPGEIGVTTMLLQIIQPKGAAPETAETGEQNKKESKQNNLEQPLGEVVEIPLSDIVIPEALAKTVPNEKKLRVVRAHVEANGKLDMPIIINKKNNNLIETYARYIVAKESNFDTVPVIYK